jgi:hypothetical protein
MIFFGAESGLNENLKEMNKDLPAEETLALTFRIRRFAIIPEFSIIFGNSKDPEGATCECGQFIQTEAAESGSSRVSDLHPEGYARGWRTGFRDSGGAAQIEMSPRTAEEIIRAFYSGGFECLTHVPLCLGEPEKPIFARGGESHLFARACQVPAVLVCHFRLDRAATTGREQLAEVEL